MGYVVKEENSQTGVAKRRGPFVTEQEARMVLANAVEQAYDSDSQLVRSVTGRKRKVGPSEFQDSRKPGPVPADANLTPEEVESIRYLPTEPGKPSEGKPISESGSARE